MLLRLLQPLLLCFSGTFVAAVASDDDVITNLVNWVKSHEGAYVSPKIQVRPMFPDRDDSPMGVFASHDISENEVIMEIPRQLYLGPNPEDLLDTGIFQLEDPPMDQVMEVYYGNTCLLAKKLLQEWDGSTDFGPFIAYLQTQSMGQLPATYSPPGKALLRKLTETPTEDDPEEEDGLLLSPGLVDWIDDHFVRTGCIQEGDRRAYHAVALVVQRGYDSELIPLWDMVNHDNGRHNVDTNSLRSEHGLRVWAKEAISAGREIFATYNFCTDCYDVGDDWGTPGIFRDFGFVEDYPQIWPFWEYDFQFRVVRDGDGNLKGEFHRDPKTGEIDYGVPDEQGLEFLKTELVRVAAFDIQEELKQMGEELKDNELYMITEYRRSMLAALAAGIEATLEEWQKHNSAPPADEL